MTALVINTCYGGFGLSDAAYEKLIEWGVPVRAYVPQKRGPDGLYLPEPLNEGEVIFDRDLEEQKPLTLSMRILDGRYWDSWIDGSRTHPLLLRVVRELGEASFGKFARLKIVEVPDGVQWAISEYDGNETVEEEHRSWR